MKKSIITAGIALSAIALSGLSFAATNGTKAAPADFAALNTAIESNNYASLPDTAKAKITETQFSEMVARETGHKSIESAITNGDYAAFKNAMIAQIPDEAEFQKMVTEHKARATTQAALETAVKNNDFAAYKTAIESKHSQMQANRPGDANTDAPKAQDASRLKARFDEMVDYYKTNGTLPEMRGMGGPGFGGPGGPGGDHGPRGMKNN